MAKKRSHPTQPTKPRLPAYTPPAMSDAELFRPQPETTALPSVLATVFSLTLHGLLWVAPPILSMSSEQTNAQRTVELVQLTPAEISRLPEFAPPGLSLPPLPPPLPSTDVLPPPSPLQQPSTQTLERQEELVRQQIVQRQQEVLQRQLRQQEELLSQQIRRNQELLQKQKLQQQQELRRQLEEEKQRREQLLQQQEKQRQDQLRQQQEKQQQAERQWLQEQEKQRQEILKQQQEQEKQRQELLRRQQELELLDQWQQQEKLIGQLQKKLQQVQISEKLKAVYGYSANGTTLEDVRKNLISFFEKIQQFAGDKKNVEQDKISISLVSPIKQKLPDVTPAGVALLIDENGNLSTDPLLTRSTGYPALNEAAIKAAIDDVKKRSFPPAGEKKIYQYEIEIAQNNEASR